LAELFNRILHRQPEVFWLVAGVHQWNSSDWGIIVKRMIFLVLLSFLIPSFVFAQEVLFEDEFEGDLSVWETFGYGIIVVDPLDPSNHALSFTQTAAAGNMFTPAFICNPLSTYVISFRYLGNAGGEDTGGYLWLIDPLYGNVDSCPVWGTQPENSNYELIDDGQWHQYQLAFQVTDFFDPIGGTLQITVEDWNGSAGSNPPPNIAGDALFDYIRLYELGAVENEAASWGKVKALFR